MGSCGSIVSAALNDEGEISSDGKGGSEEDTTKAEIWRRGDGKGGRAEGLSRERSV